VAPGALHKYCEGHEFLGPCCLCPLLAPVSEKPAFTEAAIYLTVFRHYAGEYVTECVKGRCGYIGQSPFSLKIEASIHIPPLPSAVRKDIPPGRSSGEGLPS